MAFPSRRHCLQVGVRRAAATTLVAFAAIMLLGATSVRAGEARIAVATNFTEPAKEIATAFEAATEHTAILSFGSTGQLYAQITQGAPFDAFLAADGERPEKAIDEGLAVADSRFTYATGRLVLFSADPGLIESVSVLHDDTVTKIAITNPTTAPYGAAAVEAMHALDVYDAVVDKIVHGNNVAQTYQFIFTGNAEIGFIALSQIIGRDAGSHLVVPQELHSAIAQDAVLLTTRSDDGAASAFLGFLRGPQARAIIADFGYGSGPTIGADG